MIFFPIPSVDNEETIQHKEKEIETLQKQIIELHFVIKTEKEKKNIDSEPDIFEAIENNKLTSV